MKSKQGVARPGGRASHLENIRKGKMARSPHAYVRGNTVRYYQWLERVESGALPERIECMGMGISAIFFPSLHQCFGEAHIIHIVRQYS